MLDECSQNLIPSACDVFSLVVIFSDAGYHVGDCRAPEKRLSESHEAIAS